MIRLLSFWRFGNGGVAPQPTPPSRGYYGVSFRRKRRQDEPAESEETVGQTIRGIIAKAGAPVEAGPVSVSVKPVKGTEFEEVSVDGLTKLYMDVIIVAIMASEI